MAEALVCRRAGCIHVGGLGFANPPIPAGDQYGMGGCNGAESMVRIG